MHVIAPIGEIFELVQSAKEKRQKVGVIPTMGALHEGHLSLVRAAKEECDFVVTTIFVNPTQFAPHEDLNKYPRPIDEDLKKLRALEVDAVFCPSNEDVYPKNFSTYVDPPIIAQTLEGQSRQDHFRGVATVVLKLFQMVPADIAYFGQKDFQQTLVVKRMVEDLNLPIQIKVCPIVRDADGLALSSRNAYLSTEERARALALNHTLGQVRNEILAGARVKPTLAAAQEALEATVDELEYLVFADTQSLEPIESMDRIESLEPIESPQSLGVLLVAARVGNTRLIDNMLV